MDEPNIHDIPFSDRFKPSADKLYASLDDLASLINEDGVAGDRRVQKAEDHFTAASIQQDELDQRRKARRDAGMALINEAAAHAKGEDGSNHKAKALLDALPDPDRKEVVNMVIEMATEALAARKATNRDPILVVAKRAVVADQRGIESYERSHSYGETLIISVAECHERFTEVSPSWEKFVEDHLPFGLAWANEQLRLAKLDLDARKKAMDERNKAQVEKRIANGTAAPKVEIVIEDLGVETRQTTPLTNAEKQQRKRDKAAKAAGKTTKLAPAAQRHLLNQLKGRLTGYSYETLKDVEDMLNDYEGRQKMKKAA
jgi:hypothetical protein